MCCGSLSACFQVTATCTALLPAQPCACSGRPADVTKAARQCSACAMCTQRQLPADATLLSRCHRSSETMPMQSSRRRSSAAPAQPEQCKAASVDLDAWNRRILVEIHSMCNKARYTALIIRFQSNGECSYVFKATGNALKRWSMFQFAVQSRHNG